MKIHLLVFIVVIAIYARDGETASGGSAKVYVGNLSWNTNDDSLRNAFQVYGNILDAIVMRDRDTGRSRGFGFVTFSTSEEADAAVEGLNEQELDGRRIRVNIANSKGPNNGGSPGRLPNNGYDGSQGGGGYGSGGYGSQGDAGYGSDGY